MNAEQRFTYQMFLLIGWVLGLLLGRLSAWAWWCYLAVAVLFFVTTFARACWDIFHEHRRTAANAPKGGDGG